MHVMSPCDEDVVMMIRFEGQAMPRINDTATLLPEFFNR